MSMNPYLPPENHELSKSELDQADQLKRSNTLPPNFWVVWLVLSGILIVLTPLLWFPLPLAISVVLGGFRTIAVYFFCRRASVVAPDAYKLLATSAILVLVMVVSSFIGFAVICMSLGGFVIHGPAPPAPPVISGMIMSVVFMAMFGLSIQMAIPKRKLPS